MLGFVRRTTSIRLVGVLFFILAGCGAKNDRPPPSSSTGGGAGSGGAPGDGGEIVDASAAGGSGGARPDGGTGGIIFDGPIPDSGPECVDGGRKPITKVDLLFMIDNSSSMADKQAILAAAVPDLVSRLVDPVCIDPVTHAQVGMRGADGKCATGVPDFDPVKDIHIGIITSSLGSHGASGICDDADSRPMPHPNDKGHLVARTASDVPVPTFQNQGFLNWNPTPGSGGASTPADIVGPFQTMVTGVGQHGCGYEASLESIYRFLVDPNPYDTIAVTGQGLGVAAPMGTDTALLQQRADFLRPDSLVAVIALTDENDCSILDSGQGFYAIVPPSGAPPISVLGHGTSACLTNPNDPCCYNCYEAARPGCPDKTADPECQAGPWTADKDPMNLRCWQQKRRYGVDFLYPVQRYIDGFRNAQVPDRSGKLVANPLYSDLSPDCKNGVGCAPTRDGELVFFAGVVGVPWQDVAVDPKDLSKGYLTAAQITAQGAWSKILGDPHNAAGPVDPTDPHMVESILPRPGLAGPASAATADPIHGHEWDISKAGVVANADLQYACTFDLYPPKTCVDSSDCDCFVPAGANAADAKNPLCQDKTTNAYSSTQSGAKAYPGLRQLEVLRGLGSQAIVGSICPANTRDMTRIDYGYRPVISAIVNRLRNPLRGCVVVN